MIKKKERNVEGEVGAIPSRCIKRRIIIGKRRAYGRWKQLTTKKKGKTKTKRKTMSSIV